MTRGTPDSMSMSIATEAGLPSYLRCYWGKARPKDAGGVAFHPLAYHQLDVAAVLAELLDRDPGLLATVVRNVQGEPSGVARLLTLAAALHDLGKFAPSFQTLVPELAQSLADRAEVAAYSTRHDSMGFALWCDALVPLWAASSAVRVTAGGQVVSDEDDLRDLLAPLMAASCGHHGKPPRVAPAVRFFDRRSQHDAIAYTADVLELLGPLVFATDSALALERVWARASWLMSGAFVLADWLGSDQRYFPYEAASASLETHWGRARARAKRAVVEAGLVASRSSIFSGVRELFPHIAQATPLQQHAEGCELPSSPALAIFEDATGAGKTEAALCLAQRWMAAGFADGIYVGLPTQATASGMIGRVGDIMARLYRQGQQPSLVLAHSARHLAGVRLADAPADHRYGSEEPSASLYCAAWLRDRSKAALLADVGVGTLDQALIGVLPAKHGTLRLLGLRRKVLICDEVHAYDEYTSRLLARLLTFHASLGGSAILLSATLPQQLRARFVNAFRQGADAEPVQVESTAYPLATSASAEGVAEVEIAPRAASRREVTTVFIHEEVSAIDALAAVATQGGCGAWIRNTVDDAIAAAAMLAQRIGPSNVTLFHGRFVMGDRLSIEDRVLRGFGPSSTSVTRAGQVVVATQVIEQSLDLDFDTMVTDLAPIDLLLQRAGRLRRHARTTDGERCEGGDQRGEPVLTVLAPPWTEAPSERWLHDSAIARARFVYPNASQLWNTMRVLQEHGGMRIPDHARLLVEAVYGEDAPVPDALQEATRRALDHARVAGSVAAMNALELNAGYARPHQAWLDERRTPTRLGEETTNVRLAVVRDGAARPLFTRAGLQHVAWDLSSVRVRASRLDAAGVAHRLAAAAEAGMPDKGAWSVTIVVAPTEGGTFTGAGVGAGGRACSFTYSSALGLRFE